MGAYLLKPVTDKVSTDEEDDKIRIGASSMQGWRETQEDAHNSLLNFDENTYFFAVYDGHGGREVALYCSEKLPSFIKNTDAYKNQDFQKALIDGFLGFDGTLTSEEVIAELRKLMDDPKDENDVSDEENVNKLYEEASMPLNEVIEKYKLINKNHLVDGIERLPLSPFLRCKGSKVSDEALKENENNENSSGQLDSDGACFSSSSSSKEDGVLSEKAKNTIDVSESQTEKEAESSDKKLPQNEQGDSKCEKKGTQEENKSTSTSNTKSEQNDLSNNSTEGNSEADNAKKPLESAEKSTESIEENLDAKPQENGKINKKGKVLAKTKGIVPVVKKIRPTRTAKQLYLELLDSESESDSEDEEDKTFQGPIEDSSSDEDIANIPVEVAEESSDEDDIEEEEIDEEEEDEEYDDEHGIDLGNDIPGSSSGCTAVVALMCGPQVFVANAGDSRCIISRNGKAIDLSIDHKPEDAQEFERITKAGGRVNFDGRVNGGLNLSRAIGDHSYKLNKDLPDREQMITALPDIQTFTVTSTDEFMVLACDGIWNFMSSQEVVDFVKCRLEKQPEKLSQICEELFDNCLASNTLGDGTGCDNMTAIIIVFKNGLFKRTAPCDEESSNPKRVKTDDENIVQEESV